MCMTPLALYELVCSWLSLSYLRKESLRYDERIYREALAEFWYDYIRWYPSDVQIEERKLILTPQLHPVLTYRLARLYFFMQRRKCSFCLLPVRADSRFNGNILFGSNRSGAENQSWYRQCDRGALYRRR